LKDYSQRKIKTEETRTHQNQKDLFWGIGLRQVQKDKIPSSRVKRGDLGGQETAAT